MSLATHVVVVVAGLCRVFACPLHASLVDGRGHVNGMGMCVVACVLCSAAGNSMTGNYRRLCVCECVCVSVSCV